MNALEQQAFPPIERALSAPDGLLAIGGDLTVSRLVEAYSQGIFPWYGNNEPLCGGHRNLARSLCPTRFMSREV